MELITLHPVLQSYGLDPLTTHLSTFGAGLINHTWSVKTETNRFILQRINHNVFKQPKDIAHNIRMIGDYLQRVHPDYFFVMPEKTLLQEDYVYLPEHGYFRLFPFVQGSRSIDVVSSLDQAYGAAAQFGRFTNRLSGFPMNDLRTTLENFHNLGLRYEQFAEAVKTGDNRRISQSSQLIHFLHSQSKLVAVYQQICSGTEFRQRVTHHDTKISNVLFDSADKGLCVIDLDTVMPGYFISDLGDMLRTYLCSVSEEEKDESLIEVRNDYFKAVADGYMEEMKDELTVAEKEHFVYAGKFMIYMQSLRFLTDHLLNDRYYGSKYEGHNYFRANNQAVLLKTLMAKEKDLERMLR